jgi:hypothetical protein
MWYIFPHFGILYQEKSGNPADRVIFCPRKNYIFYIIGPEKLLCKYIAFTKAMFPKHTVRY